MCSELHCFWGSASAAPLFQIRPPAATATPHLTCCCRPVVPCQYWRDFQVKIQLSTVTPSKTVFVLLITLGLPIYKPNLSPASAKTTHISLLLHLMKTRLCLPARELQWEKSQQFVAGIEPLIFSTVNKSHLSFSLGKPASRNTHLKKETSVLCTLGTVAREKEDRQLLREMIDLDYF